MQRVGPGRSWSVLIRRWVGPNQRPLISSRVIALPQTLSMTGPECAQVTGSDRPGRLLWSLAHVLVDFRAQEHSQRRENGQGMPGGRFSGPGDHSGSILDNLYALGPDWWLRFECCDIATVATSETWTLQYWDSWDFSDYSTLVQWRLLTLEHWGLRQTDVFSCNWIPEKPCCKILVWFENYAFWIQLLMVHDLELDFFFEFSWTGYMPT